MIALRGFPLSHVRSLDNISQKFLEQNEELFDLHGLGIGAPGKMIEYMSAHVAPHLLVISLILSDDNPSGLGSCASQRIS